jgi:hypothetical protein
MSDQLLQKQPHLRTSNVMLTVSPSCDAPDLGCGVVLMLSVLRAIMPQGGGMEGAGVPRVS